LEAVLFPESFLERMVLSIASEPFNSHDGRPIGLHGEQGARLGCLAVHQDCARTAQCAFTSDVSSGQSCYITDIVHKQHTRLDFIFPALSVNDDVYPHDLTPGAAVPVT
jgi:hypothetical protein